MTALPVGCFLFLGEIDNDRALTKPNEFSFVKKSVSPVVLALLTEVIRRNGGFKTEGLFRLASDTEDVQFYKDALNRGDYRCASTCGSVHVGGCCYQREQPILS